MKRFINDLKKYKYYVKFATKSKIKNEVIDSYLGWIWIFLEPLIFMLIYAFISVVVFGRSQQYLAAFIFIGLTIWKFFNSTIVSSVRLVPSNRDTVTKVYVPKFILLLIDSLQNLFKLFVSFILVGLFMVYYQVDISWNILYIIPIILVLFVITFGFACLFMHFGVFVDDLNKIVPLGMRFMFYLSGIFYSISDRVPKPYSELLLICNPIACLIHEARNVLLYSTAPNLLIIFIWLLIGLFLCFIGIRTIYKYENTYVKVMK